MSRYLLGYDLRPDIARPASIDPMIWPSLFRYLHLSPTPVVAVAIVLHGDDERVRSDHSIALLDARDTGAAPPPTGGL